MSRSPVPYLHDILIEAEFLCGNSVKFSYQTFLADDIARRAFVRSLEVIGEATKRIADDVRHAYPNIPWKAMAGMRDRLIHRYDEINYETVWRAVKEEIPSLVDQLRGILKSLEG